MYIHIINIHYYNIYYYTYIYIKFEFYLKPSLKNLGI